MTFDYLECSLNKEKGIFIGQYKFYPLTNEAVPEGFVRFISYAGNVYEGCAKNGFYDAFGRFTYSHSQSLGYWKLTHK